MIPGAPRMDQVDRSSLCSSITLFPEVTPNSSFATDDRAVRDRWAFMLGYKSSSSPPKGCCANEEASGGLRDDIHESFVR